MIESISHPESFSQTSQLDEARVSHPKETSLSAGVNMLQLDTPSDNEPGRRMQELISGLAKALVDNPESVNVEVITEANSTVLRLRVAAVDIGKVIGKQGRTARSIRTILSAASMKLQHRFAIDIVEEGLPHTVRAVETQHQE